jgi:hypothetical protein
MNEDDKRRADDILVAQLSQRFNDFIERYDRDCGADNERERIAREENNKWKEKMEIEMKAQSKILEEISPAYMKGKWIVGIVMVGSIGIAIKEFWNHVLWK